MNIISGNIWVTLGKGKGLLINICVVEGPILEMESGRGFFVNTLEEKRTWLEFLKISGLLLKGTRV